MSDWQVQYAERMAVADLAEQYRPVLRAVERTAKIAVVDLDPAHVELLRFLASWDGPGVTEERLVGYAVDWLTNP
jgi:hypothetical protein